MKTLCSSSASARAIEVLAPAGDFEAMQAAVANGASAVYFGLRSFNARHRATNFTIEKLPETIEYLHNHNVRGYVTFNTLIFPDELAQAAKLIQTIAAAGADAVIVQDLGLAALIHQLTPGLPVHGSTQMTLTEPRGIDFVRQLGVERVILARELSIKEIRQISAVTDMPVEVFVHGALCVAYSGQCLTSESLGGRSANRGQCAQACRLPYDLVVDGQTRALDELEYLLSPQDLAAYDLVDQLVDAGVCSLKIEGRLKSPHYVAQTTATYAEAAQAAVRGERFALDQRKQIELAQSFSRGFTHGFLDGVDHQALVHGRFPKSRGVRLGMVTHRHPRGLVVELDAPLASLASMIKPGDGVVFDQGHPEQDEQGGRLASVEPYILSKHQPGQKVQLLLGFRAGDINTAAVEVGSIVWKTDDPALRRQLEQTFSRDRVVHPIALRMVVTAGVDQPLQLTVCDDQSHEIAVSTPYPLQAAQKFPLTLELLRDQLGRLGGTPYTLESLTLESDGTPLAVVPVMAPKSVLNELRRRAISAMGEARKQPPAAARGNPNALQEWRAGISQQQHDQNPAYDQLHVLVRRLDQLDAVLEWHTSKHGSRLGYVYCDFEDIRGYQQAVQRARATGVPVALAGTRVIKPGEEGLLRQLAQCQPDAALVRNLGSISWFKQHQPNLQLLGDYSLNVANDLTADLFQRAGLRRLTPSYDLNWQQLQAMLNRVSPLLFEVVVHQHMPMFHMEHCVFAHTLSAGRDYRSCGRPCDSHQVNLRDRVSVEHPLIADVGCRNTVYNGVAQSAAQLLPRMQELGLRQFRVELLRESMAEVGPLLDRYARVLAGETDGQSTWRQLKVLNQLGVTRGTMDYE